MDEARELTQVVEDAVRRGATTVEEIHRDVAALPLAVLETLGLPAETARDVRRVHDDAIGAVYDVIRSVNHRVANLAQELLQDPA